MRAYVIGFAGIADILMMHLGSLHSPKGELIPVVCCVSLLCADTFKNKRAELPVCLSVSVSVSLCVCLCVHVCFLKNQHTLFINTNWLNY